MPRRVRRLLLATMVVWVLLTAGSVYVHTLAWSAKGDAATTQFLFGLGGERACKSLANISQVVTLPGWIVTWIGMGWFESGAAAAVASAVGWACLLTGVWIVGGTRWFLRTRFILATCREASGLSAEVSPRADSGDAGRALSEHADGKLLSTRRLAPAGATRRAFLLDGVLVSTAVLGGGTVAYSSFVGPWSIVVRRYRVPIRGLPPALDGLRLVQISDTHLGPRIPREHVERAVQLALGLKPDLFVLTGDYVHMGTAHIAPAAALFKPLTAPGAAPLGVVGVLGNHDFYADGPAMSRALQAIGVRMIDNDRVFIDAALRRITSLVPSGPALCLAGLGDLLEDRIDPRSAFREVPDEMPRVVLAHNPDTAEHPDVTGVTSRKFYPAEPTRAPGGSPMTASRIDLMLSGHTHGGQVRIPFMGTPGIPSRFGQKYASGVVQGPICRVLVSTGIGMSVLPVRFGVPPEVVEITLCVEA